MGPTSLTPIAWPESTSPGFSRAKNRPICRSSRSTKVDMIINLKTAKALGLNVPTR